MKLWTAEVAHSPFATTPLIADVNADGHLDIVAAPLSETQTLPSAYVKRTWYTDVVSASGDEISNFVSSTNRPDHIPVDGHIMATPVIADLNGDHKMNELKLSGFPGYVLFSPTVIDMDRQGSYLEVVVGTSAGNVHVIDLEGGVRDRKGFPYSMGTIHGQVFLSNDGVLHVISTDQSCRAHFPIGETSLVQILSHDLVSHSEGMELLISTSDGTVICMGSGEETIENVFADEFYHKILALAWPAETPTPNDFLFAENKMGIFVKEGSRKQGEVTGSQFYIMFYITDASYKSASAKVSAYTLRVYFGSTLLHRAVYTSPSLYTIFVSSFPRPSHGHITLVLTNNNGQLAQDTFPIRFNQIILEDLQWLLMSPFVAMVIILLVNHGFPAKDLFPQTIDSKNRYFLCRL
ncbi:DEX1-like protein [Mya arenaria]|uniref:DEX1-like protein n=1 Tax=Mya arenaria TaxID=6604 RepID=A0ABY7FCU6_MYAAR|nr:DEX1-like protein [Mya arenaria]